MPGMLTQAADPRLEADPSDQPGEPAADDEATKLLRDALAAQVARRIKEAMEAREASGIEEIWDEDADQYDGIDALSAEAKNVKDAGQEKKGAPDGRSRIFLNITKPKTDAAVARVQEMLVPNDDKPWAIEPTPIPELEDVQENPDRTLTLGDGTEAKAADVAAVVMQRAKKKADKMADWIEDQFVEGSVYAEMRKMIRDAGRLGTGCIKGPFSMVRTERKWQLQGNVALLQITDKTSPTSKRVDIRDCYPDPACGENIHEGSYFVERDYMTARQLRRLAKVKGYDAQAIAESLREGPRNNARDAKRFRDVAGESVKDSDVFEVFYYYGDVDPDTLLALGIAKDTIREEDLYLASVPSIVTMLNGRPIKAAINPLETGEFPYDFFCWECVEGQPWGRGVPRKMQAAQRMLVASVRALMENGGLSKGPQVGIAEGLVPFDGNYNIVGRKLWKFTPTEANADINKAMAVWNIPSAQRELSAIVDFALKMADELTNLPMLLQGQQGTAPELVKGMQMLMANASAPLRVIAKQFDDQFVIPHLRRYYDWGMQSGPDDAKGDMQIQARGSTALIQREFAREVLAQTYPMTQDERLKIDPAKWAAEFFKAHGFNLAGIQYDEATWQAMQDVKAQQPPPVEPSVEVAKIRAEVDKAKMAQAAQQAAFDREVELIVNQMKVQVQAMEFAGNRDISMAQVGALLDRLKADLAKAAIASRDKRELFLAERQLKLDPANPTNQGI